MNNVVVSGSFDDIHSRDIRFLEEAAKLGHLHVLLWSDEVVRQLGPISRIEPWKPANPWPLGQ